MPGFVPSQGALQQLYSSLTTYSYSDTTSGLTASPQTFVNNFLTNLNATTYDEMSNAIKYWLTSSAPASALGLQASASNNPPGLRVQVIEADGTTSFDSNVGANNVFTNIKIPKSDFLTSGKYLINENQGTRSYNMGAILSQSGIYYMSKYSNSIGYNQSYIAVRQGASPALPLGNIVISINGNI
jgi:hypothetical protein